MASGAISGDWGAITVSLYDAAFSPKLWPDVLQQIADVVGAKGGAIIAVHSGRPVRWLASPGIAQIVDEHAVRGWFATLSHQAPDFADPPGGFFGDVRYRAAADVDALPAHVRFSRPRGPVGLVVALIRANANDVLHVMFEGFDTHLAAERAVKALDRLRPHLARAVCATSQVRDLHAHVTIAALAQVNLPAAIVRQDGTVHVSNSQFAEIAETLGVVRQGVGLSTAAADRRFRLAAAKASDSRWRGESLVVRKGNAAEAMVVHLLPLLIDAPSPFDLGGFLLVGARPADAALPSSDLLRLLFDLTPAEARVTRALLEGSTVAEVSGRLKISSATARIHLRHIFAKTGTSRQANLIRLLGGIARPEQG